MKKFLILMAFLIGSGINAQHRAQKHSQNRETNPSFTTEQRATIQSKRMALSLGLDAPQQAQLEEVLKEHLSALSEIREMRKTSNGTEASESSPTKFERLNERLDRQIAFQEELKGILTDSQFDQWRAHVERKKPRRKHRHR